MAQPRKQFPLRIPQELFDAYDGWASDELRSVNAQIEAVLTDAARRSGRLRDNSNPAAPQREGEQTSTDKTVERSPATKEDGTT